MNVSKAWLTRCLAPGLLVLVLPFAAAPVRADAAADRESIRALMICYVHGNDAMGDAITNADPLAKGLSFYHQCLADDVVVQGWFPGVPFSSQTFPDPGKFPGSAPPAFHGPEAWAEHVNSVFRSKGFKFTQHALSNVDVTVNGASGALTAYLTATLVVPGPGVGKPSQCVTVANGTFSAETAKRNNVWKITRLNVTLITFNPVFQSGAGCL